MTLSGMRAPNKQNFWPARNWTASDGTVGLASGWTGVSVSSRLYVVPRHVSSHSTHNCGAGVMRRCGYGRGRGLQRGKTEQNHKLQIERLLDGTGQWSAPRSSHLALHRGREPTGLLWHGYGEIRTTARDNNWVPSPRVPGDGQINMADQDSRYL